MRKFLLPFVIITMSLTGCFYMEPVRISAAGDSMALQSLDPTVWRSNPARVIFQNRSDRIYVKIWVGRNPIGTPDLELGPEEGQAFSFSGIGEYTIHLAGREAIAFGWRDLGTKKRSASLSPTHSFGSIQEISVGDWDFADYYW